MAFNQLAKDRPRLLIVGGGYAGFTLAQKLQTRIKESGGVVTVVDPNPYMTYLPFLPEVAAGNVDARSAVISHRQHLRDCELIDGRVEHIDHANRKVTIRGIDAGPEFELPYDDIVVTGGSNTRTFPIPGLAEKAIGMKTIEEAVSVRNWVLERIETASLTDSEEEKRQALTFIVVGGGYAGSETVAELEDMARSAVERNDRLRVSDLRFVLVEAMGRIMPEVSKERAEKVVAEMRARGIEVLLNTSISEVDGDVVKLMNMGDKSPAGDLATDTLIWCAGVQAAAFVKNSDFPVDERGRVRVGADLRVTGDDGPLEGAWAAGDIAAVPDLTGSGPGGFCVPNAQHAVRQAATMAKNIVAAHKGEPLEDYYHENLGSVAGLGLYKGAATIRGVDLGGLPAWAMHRLYHGYAIPTVERKVRVFTEWGINMIFGRDTTALRHLHDPRRAFLKAAGENVPTARARL
ncbi:NAD(P)/FAD-dependent oxidoreductase [Kocuria tytonis]|uniref:NAD(P)/FAD-dependent oxidoreductase n=1 Tax=Kocuria tytonis TaxID=2054280 RepID=A0A495A3Q6_9MICC|nr:NAD(P)/FAD-dependent oxidoreductase [Kocuria tytonis]RKQ34117.1 NAD(P)/FAD-dependent oxidoreductase [Kocuria tytonis]